MDKFIGRKGRMDLHPEILGGSSCVSFTVVSFEKDDKACLVELENGEQRKYQSEFVLNALAQSELKKFANIIYRFAEKVYNAKYRSSLWYKAEILRRLTAPMRETLHANRRLFNFSTVALVEHTLRSLDDLEWKIKNAETAKNHEIYDKINDIMDGFESNSRRVAC